MKSPIILCSLLFSSFVFAEGKSLPSLPADCAAQIESSGLFCSSISVAGDMIDVTFLGLADKGTFPTVDSLIERYLDFARWPEFVKNSPQDVVVYKSGGSVAYETKMTDDGRALYPQFFDYDLKVQGIPLLRQNVRGVTYNYDVDAYDGALRSIEFQAQKGPLPEYKQTLKGMNSQIGSVHALECTGQEFCDDSKWLVVFYTRVQPNLSIAMNITAKTMQAGIEDILTGMLEE